MIARIAPLREPSPSADGGRYSKALHKDTPVQPWAKTPYVQGISKGSHDALMVHADHIFRTKDLRFELIPCLYTQKSVQLQTTTRVLFASLTAISRQFNRDIQIADVDCNYILASALLDTQCQDGNWISLRLVQRLRMQDRISLEFESPALTDAGGRAIVACGIISLQWKWSPIGTRVHECKFFVFPGSRHLDVIFGVHYILAAGLITVNEGAMTPMTAHNRATPAERAAIALALEKQKREKAAREACRIQQQQAERQQGAQSSLSQQN
ncbi:MAG: hypothetical protein Q9198_007987, partial [Flavoplaca austrocitrina]